MIHHPTYVAALAMACASIAMPGCSQIGSGPLGDTGTSCTLMGCGQEGVRVDFSYKEVGAYVVDVTIDGAKHSCTASIPLSKQVSGDDPCVAAGIYLTRIGSEMPVAQQSIGGLVINSTNAATVSIRITRDGKLIKEGTFSPKYIVTPGPNGPNCEPKQCTAATFSLT